MILLYLKIILRKFELISIIHEAYRAVLRTEWAETPSPKLTLEKHAPKLHFIINTYQTWHIHIS